MQNTMQNNDFTAYYVCKFTQGLNIVRNLGFNIFEGRNGRPLYIRECEGCNGAHTPAQFKTYPDNHMFNHMNKSKYDWIQLYHIIIKTLQTDSVKLKDAMEKQSISSCLDKNFFEILQVWKTIALKYRKEISKLDEAGTAHVLPTFTLPDDLDKIAFSLERTTHLCYHTTKLNEMVRTRQKMDINDICLGTGHNCKFGVNKTTELLCTSDFLTGVCGCITKENLETRTSEMKATIVSLQFQLEEVIKLEESAKEDHSIMTTNRFEMVVKPKNKKAIEKLKVQIQQQLQTITTELKQLGTSRMIHYTDYNMVPFEKQLKSYNDMKDEEARATAAKLQSLDDLIKVTQTNKPIISLGKLGKKK